MWCLHQPDTSSDCDCLSCGSTDEGVPAVEMEPPIDEKEPQARGKADLTECAVRTHHEDDVAPPYNPDLSSSAATVSWWTGMRKPHLPGPHARTLMLQRG